MTFYGYILEISACKEILISRFMAIYGCYGKIYQYGYILEISACKEILISRDNPDKSTSEHITFPAT